MLPTFLVLFVFPLFFAVNVSTDSLDPCRSLTSCGECIQKANCVWCANMNTVNVNNLPRCLLRDNLNTCPAGNVVVDPQPMYTIIQVTESARDVLRPQKVSLSNLRLGQPFNISLQFKVVKNYPADLYYLMDVSNSMSDDRDNLLKLAGSLVDAMRNITTDFKIGFGSFFDKNAMSIFHSPDDSFYSFRHQLKLDENGDKFSNVVNNTPIIRGTTWDDIPEGGFDALLQAMVCEKEIGWRNKAHRLIVFTTDALSHFAGNGKIGGVIRPNDGECHLNSTNVYDMSLLQDYPSLGQISRIAKNKAINIIFAVTETVNPTYFEFADLISGASVGTLTSDSSNIVTIINNTYMSMISTVEMKDTSSDGIKIRYFTACTGTLVRESNMCKNLHVDDIVNFTITVEATVCPQNIDNFKRLIQIYPVGVNESLTLDLEVVCGCPCEKPGNQHYVLNAPQCNSVGDLVCGACKCGSQNSGLQCECSGNSTDDNLESQCNATDGILCSNHGSCVCGKCECFKRPNPSEVYSGKYCECDNFSCERNEMMELCSKNGECQCGQCSCYQGWTGSACGCKTGVDTCIPEGGEEVCFGNGECVCGKCNCSSISQGTFCQDCPTCPSKCEEYVPCVQCKVFQTGPYVTNGQCDKECTYPIETRDKVEVEQISEKECYYENEEKCKVKFIYGFDSITGGKKVRVQQNPECPQTISYAALGGLFGLIIAAGIIALILYRICTYLKDRREYAQFLENEKNAKWNRETNPLYAAPTTTFKNPAYKSN